MTVEVRLFATLAQFLPPGSRSGSAMVDVPDGATIADVVNYLGIPPGLDRVLLLNGSEAQPEQVVQSGDVVDIFPPLAGGTASAGWYTRRASEASRNPVGLPDFKSGVRL